MATSLEFKLPTELAPMPVMGSDDEESFVILGKSLASDVDVSLNNLNLEPIPSGPIEEGQKLINMELSRLDESSKSTTNREPGICISSISLSPEEVQQKVDSLIGENVKLRDTIIKNNIAMESQHKKIVAWKEEVQKTHQSHKQKFAEAKEFISKLKADKEFLTAELAKCKEIKDMYERELFLLKDEFKQMNKSQTSFHTPDTSVNKEEEFLIANRKIAELEEMLNKMTLTNNALENENETLKSTKSEPDTEKQQLSNVVEEQNKVIENLNKKIKDIETSAQTVIKNMNTEIINLRSQLCLTVNLQEDLDNTRKQLMNSQSSITCLQHANSNLMAQLGNEQENMKKLKDLELMKDDYFALQQQVEAYKADFEAERSAKENLRSEKEQIISDFLQIQKRNNELNEEIELLKERGFEVIASSHRSTSSTNSSVASNASTQGRKYCCPICNFGFTTYQALENHVERCMELSTSLP